jgi:hypothetical protein
MKTKRPLFETYFILILERVDDHTTMFLVNNLALGPSNSWLIMANSLDYTKWQLYHPPIACFSLWA